MAIYLTFFLANFATMYQNHKIFILVLFTIVCVLSYYFKIEINKDFIISLITFYSIVLGFYMTSIAMIYGSNYAKSLSKIEDKKKTGQTLLHTLRKYFKSSFHFLIWSILISLASLLIHSSNQTLCSFVLALLTTNIFLLILFFKILTIGLIEETKN